MFKIFSKKFVSVIIIAVFIIPIFLPSNQTYAVGIFDKIKSTATNAFGGALGRIGKGIISAPFSGLGWLSLEMSQGLVNGGAMLANLSIHNKLGTAYSYTNPAHNPIIEVGWKLIRDFTNMFFIIGLAFIGLSTALNWGGFETKKALGKILLIALIINFSPIICGVAVDISNIIMKFFISNANFDGLSAAYDALQNNLSDQKWDISAAVIFQTLTLSLIAILLFILLLAISLYFLIRVIMIWMLVIISPIAFFSWIFKQTQGLYNMWIKQFYFWVISAIPIAFVIYLFTYIMARMPDVISGSLF